MVSGLSRNVLGKSTDCWVSNHVISNCQAGTQALGDSAFTHFLCSHRNGFQVTRPNEMRRTTPNIKYRAWLI